LQTALLTDQITWEPWEALPGAFIPTRESIDAILPGFYDKYNPATRANMDKYHEMLVDRFKQRRDFLLSSDLKEKPEVQAKLVETLNLK
jgi:phosphoenolpyruvate carboxykinase (ATP)